MDSQREKVIFFVFPDLSQIHFGEFSDALVHIADRHVGVLVSATAEDPVAAAWAFRLPTQGREERTTPKCRPPALRMTLLQRV